MFYTPTPDYYNDYIAHHGIIGQSWGHKNGPPYPLDSSKSTGSRLKNEGSVKKKKNKKMTKEEVDKLLNKARKELGNRSYSNYLARNDFDPTEHKKHVKEGEKAYKNYLKAMEAINSNKRNRASDLEDYDYMQKEYARNLIIDDIRNGENKYRKLAKKASKSVNNIKRKDLKKYAKTELMFKDTHRRYEKG